MLKIYLSFWALVKASWALVKVSLALVTIFQVLLVGLRLLLVLQLFFFQTMVFYPYLLGFDFFHEYSQFAKLESILFVAGKFHEKAEGAKLMQ